MTELCFKSDDLSGDKIISAFAFDTGRLIEKIIDERTNNLFDQKQELEALILGFYNKLSTNIISDQLSIEDIILLYKEYFKIKTNKVGFIED